MGPTTLFTHLKIILLQCFQFSVFSFSKISPIQTDPNWILQRSTSLVFYRGTQATLLSSLTADLSVHKLDLKEKNYIYLFQRWILNLPYLKFRWRGTSIWCYADNVSDYDNFIRMFWKLAWLVDYDNNVTPTMKPHI